MDISTPEQVAELVMEAEKKRAALAKMKRDFAVKDSGKREEYASGMVRDTVDNKPKFSLLHPMGVPFEEQILTRFAVHMTKGAKKYGERNWEKASGEAEMQRFMDSAERHLAQWIAGDRDEDHAMAVFFNIMAYETTRYKLGRVDQMQYDEAKELEWGDTPDCR